MEDHHLAHFQMHGELNDFLSSTRRGQRFDLRFQGRPSTKDTIESLNIPHPEVGLILIDGAPVGFDHHLRDGALVDVHPARDVPAVEGAPALRPPSPTPPRFILDVHLKKLARDLRLLGLDSVYAHVAISEDAEIAERAAREDRILLTRDIGLLKRRIVHHGRWVRATQPDRQIREIMTCFKLGEHLAPFTRCLVCNDMITQATPEEIAGRVPDTILAALDEFHRCVGCERVYWAGSHHDKLVARVEALTNA